MSLSAIGDALQVFICQRVVETNRRLIGDMTKLEKCAFARGMWYISISDGKHDHDLGFAASKLDVPAALSEWWQAFGNGKQ